MPLTICQAQKNSGALCGMRRGCKHYDALLDLAIAHTDIRLAKESKAVAEIPAKFTSKASVDTCVNFKEI